MAESIESSVGKLRSQRGISVAALASQAGVSRQALYAIEAGTYVPNTAVSLRLAAALGTAVDQLFRLRNEEQPTAVVDLIESTEPVEPGSALQVCRVGDRRVAIWTAPVPAYLPAGNAVLRAVKSAHRAVVEPVADDTDEAQLVIAGCDPAMSLLAERLRGSGVNVALANCSSMRALRLLRDGLVHVAGTHLARKTPTGTAFRGGKAAVYTYATWEEGFVVAAGNPKKIRTAADLGNPRVRIVNRETGAGSRVLLDAELRRAGIAARAVKGYTTYAAGHLAAAWHVKSDLADCCVAPRAAARAFQLGFVPIVSERYDLVVPGSHTSDARIAILLETLNGQAFRKQLTLVAGYDTTQTGSRIS